MISLLLNSWFFLEKILYKQKWDWTRYFGTPVQSNITELRYLELSFIIACSQIINNIEKKVFRRIFYKIAQNLQN